MAKGWSSRRGKRKEIPMSEELAQAMNQQLQMFRQKFGRACCSRSRRLGNGAMGKARRYWIWKRTCSEPFIIASIGH